MYFHTNAALYPSPTVEYGSPWGIGPGVDVVLIDGDAPMAPGAVQVCGQRFA